MENNLTVDSLPMPLPQESMVPMQKTVMSPPDGGNAHGTTRGARRCPPAVRESALATAAELPSHSSPQHFSAPRNFSASIASRTTKTRIDPTRSPLPNFYASRRKQKYHRHTDHGSAHSPPPPLATRTLCAYRSPDERERSGAYRQMSA